MTIPRVARRSTAALAAAALVASVSVAACGGDGGPGDGVFTVGHSEPDHLIPGNTTSSYAFDVLGGLFENLVGLDEKGETVMLAAESVETEDQRVWTIRLRPDRRFHNGDPVTAQSFADAWNHAAYGPNAYEANDYFSYIEGYDALNSGERAGPGDVLTGAGPRADTLSGLKVLGPRTLEVTLKEPFNQFPLLLTYPAYAPMPKVAFEDLTAYEKAPIGNGPYKISGTWERNEQIKLVPFEGYRGPRKPRNRGVIWKSYSSAETAYTDLRAGRIDVLQTIPAAKVPEAERLLGDRFLPRKTGTMDYLGFPLWDGRFADARLRRAFSMAIDRKGINKAVYNGDYTVADSLLPPIVPGHRPGACGRACTYDPAEAKRLFDRAGGFEGTLQLYFSNAQPTYYQWMRIVANSLKTNLGITDVQFRQVPAADYFGMLSRREEKGPYRQNWEADYLSAQNYLQNMWGGTGNKMGWEEFPESSEFDALIAKGNAAPTQREALTFYQRAEDLAIREMPMIPLWTWAGQGGRSENVDNVTITPYSSGLLAHEVTVK